MLVNEMVKFIRQIPQVIFYRTYLPLKKSISFINKKSSFFVNFASWNSIKPSLSPELNGELFETYLNITLGQCKELTKFW